MKISNKKIIISTLALAMGAALAGSISGSVAWYQYSTRAAAQLKGTSIGTTGSLQVKLNGAGNYTTSVSNSARDQFKPISASGTEAGSLTYYRAPVAREEKLPAYDPANDTIPYVDYTLSFIFLENNVQVAKNVYLTMFEIEDASGTAYDVSSAVRVEIIGTNSFFLSQVEEDDTTTDTVNELETITHGNLDLDPEGLPGSGIPDTKFWQLDDSDYAADHSKAIDYMNGTSPSYVTQAHEEALVEVTDPYDLDTGNTDKILTTTKTGSAAANITVRVWLEGWQLLNSSAKWSDDYIGQNFNINMQFACSATK